MELVMKGGLGCWGVLYIFCVGVQRNTRGMVCGSDFQIFVSQLLALKRDIYLSFFDITISKTSIVYLHSKHLLLLQHLFLSSSIFLYHSYINLTPMPIPSLAPLYSIKKQY